MTGASAALHFSDIPWAGPFAGVRVGRVDGEFDRQPDLRAARDVRPRPRSSPANRDAIVMVEGGGGEVSEEVIVDALMFAHKAVAAADRPAGEAAGGGGQAEARVRAAGEGSGDRRARSAQLANQKIEAAMAIREKQRALRGARRGRRARPRRRSSSEFPDRDARGQRRVRVGQEEAPARAGAEHRAAASTAARRRTSAPITCEVGVLPRTHGSALFTRGETQALVTTTLGTSQDEQHIEGAHRRHREALHAALQLPALLDGRDQAAARPGPARDRPRRPGRARAGARAAERQGLPLHHPHRLRDPRVERQLVDGVGLRRHAGADGRGRSDQDAGRGHRDGPDQGRRPRRRPVRHPRRRGSPRRHGLQGLRHQGRASPRSRWTSRSRA